MTSGDLSIGDILRQARESMGLSIGDVSSLLHISDEYVHGLENNQFDVMPAPIYVKGYIRNYAKLVQVEGEELVQAYTKFIQESGNEPKTSEELVSLSPELPKSIELRWIGFGALILIFVIVFATFSTGNKTNGFFPDDLISSDGKESILDLETPDTENVADDFIQVEENGKPLPKDSPSSESLDNTLDASQKIDESLILTDKSIDQPVKGSDTLFMFFNGECWVSVKDAHDFEIYASLKKAGDSLELSGVAPFEVLLGAAAVVNLNFNGKTVALEPFTRKDSGTAVVRLNPEPTVEIPY